MPESAPPRRHARHLRHLWLPTAVVALALVATALKPPATAQPAAEEDPPLVTKTYNLAGLVGETPYAYLPELALEDVWSSPWPNHHWGPGVHPGGWSVDELDEFNELLNAISYALGPEHDATAWDLAGPLMVEVEASERFHELLGDCLRMLRALNETVIHFELLRLEDRPDRAVLGPAEASELSGQLVGRQSIRNSGVGILSQVSQRTITSSIQFRHEEHSAVADTHPLYWGEQWVFGGVVLADGSVRVQGAHLHAAEPIIRDYETHEGNVQLPQVPYSITPGAATLVPGGGLVFDTNRGAYLLRVVPSAAIPNLTSGDVTIHNPGAWYVPGHMKQIWMLESSASDEWGQVIPREDSRGIGRHGLPAGAEHLYSFLTELSPRNADVAAYLWGPLVLTRREDLKPDDVERTTARAALDALYAEGAAGPEGVEFRVSIVQVPADADIPEGFVRGAPSPAEIAQMLADPATTKVFERSAVLVAGQEIDLLSAEIENFVHTAKRYTHPQIETDAWSIWVASHGRGTQVRLSLAADSEVLVHAAWRPVSTLHTHQAMTRSSRYRIQAPEGTTVSMLVDAALPKGAAICVVQPAPDNTRAILLVQRKGDQ